MRIPPIALSAAAAPLLLVSLTAQSPTRADEFWPQWRGPLATGVSTTATPPLEWSDTKNIKWKVEIPGRGSASPVVWGDRLFLLTAVPVGVAMDATHAPRGAQLVPHKFVVLAIDRHTGRTLWERVVREQAPHEATHPENGTWASSSAVTDGELVIASFESAGVYAFDMDGKPVWQKDLGEKRMRSQFGEGSTPALHGNRLVIVWDHQGESFITALDTRTGAEVWRQKRDEIDSWATPLVVMDGDRAQVVTAGMNRVRAYDLETGALIWHAPGLTMNPIPSPVAGDGLVYVTSGFRGNNLKAIRVAGAKGDLTGTEAIRWTLDRDTPYVPSPLLYGGIIYLLKTNSGLLSAYDAKTGTPHFQVQRLEHAPEVFASPVGAAGRVYITARDGVTVVIKNAPAFEILAENRLSDGFDASPALVGGNIYMRGYKYLYCIGQ